MGILAWLHSILPPFKGMAGVGMGLNIEKSLT
jgi:hypothetical protein